MEKFFKPVHGPSGLDETKPRKHHQHHHHHLPHHHHQDPQSNRYTMFDDTDRNTDESHGHHRHHQHDRYLHNNPHHDAHHFQTQQFHHSEEDEILYNHKTSVTLSRASSSSLSSSSSSTSFSSWYTEESANDPFSLRHAEQPQHSLSCSNISDVRRGFREDDGSEPVVFATIKHDKKGSVCSETHGSAQKRGKQSFASLDRGHSRSEQGLLQGNDGDLGGKQSRVPHISYGPLYKSASLNRSLAFSEEDLLLGDSRGPKRAVSSIQLPSKGILKNKEPRTDIRKAKSMEVLSPRVSREQDPSGKKGKGPTQVEIEQARANFVEGKLQFSAFLDEITKQVISPSALNVLGVNSDKTTGKTPAPAPTPGPVKPQLPPKKRRESSGEEREQHPKQHSRQEKAAPSSSRKHSDCSNPDKLISYAARNHHGSPPPHHQRQSPSLNAHHESSHKDRRPLPTGGSVSGDRYGRGGPHLTDGTSTSPEPSQPSQRHHRKKQPTASHSQHTQHFPQHQPQPVHPGSHGHRGPASSPPSSAQGAGPGLGSESSSTKSDSSRARDTGSTATSPNSEQSGRHQSQHVGHSKQRRDTLCDADHLLALQEENSDLHQNLLQTVVCIESLEVELQRTRDELNHVKEKYKSDTFSPANRPSRRLSCPFTVTSESLVGTRALSSMYLSPNNQCSLPGTYRRFFNRLEQLDLLETHTGTKQANNLLGEHLHIASESLSSERKYLQNRVSQLSSELEDAHRTIAALENINVPCLIKELLEKHFDSAEAIQKFLTTPAPISHPATSLQAADGAPKVKEAAHDWLTKSDAGLQRVTAFLPFKQEVPTIVTEGSLSSLHESNHSPPFSVADISTAIYKKMAASYAAKPVYPQSQQQIPQSTNHADPPANLQQTHVGGDSWGGRGEVKVTLLEQDVVHVTSMSAQQILDDFLQQLQPHGGVTEQQGGQEWAGGAEQAGKVAE